MHTHTFIKPQSCTHSLKLMYWFLSEYVVLLAEEAVITLLALQKQFLCIFKGAEDKSRIHFFSASVTIFLQLFIREVFNKVFTTH